MTKHVHRKTERTPEETARVHADRERYQRDKPNPEQLLAEGGHDDCVALGDLMALHQVKAPPKVSQSEGLTALSPGQRPGGGQKDHQPEGLRQEEP